MIYLATPTPEGHTFDPADPRHGKASSYSNYKCRCQPCKDAWAARQKDYMDRHPEQRDKHAARLRAGREK